MINSYLVNITLIIIAISSCVPVLFPEVDIIFSEYFFEEIQGFIYKKNFFVYGIYKILPLLTKVFTVFCISYLILYLGYICIINIYNFGRVSKSDIDKVLRSRICFLFVAAIIGPGILINGVFKEHFGRARPAQITIFNGSKEFTPAFKLTDQCSTNCSFSSGHAGMGFYFSALAYIASLKYFNRIYILGLLFGAGVGLSRIMMGGHFLSDVLVSAFVVLLSNHLLFILRHLYYGKK